MRIKSRTQQPGRSLVSRGRDGTSRFKVNKQMESGNSVTAHQVCPTNCPTSLQPNRRPWLAISRPGVAPRESSPNPSIVDPPDPTLTRRHNSHQLDQHRRLQAPIRIWDSVLLISRRGSPERCFLPPNNTRPSPLLSSTPSLQLFCRRRALGAQPKSKTAQVQPRIPSLGAFCSCASHTRNSR